MLRERDKLSAEISTRTALNVKQGERAYLAAQVAEFARAGGKVDVIPSSTNKGTDDLTKKAKERMHVVRL